MKVEIFHNNESVTAWDFPVGSDASITIEVDGAPWAGATFTDDDALALGYWTGLEAEWVEVLPVGRLQGRAVQPRVHRQHLHPGVHTAMTCEGAP